MLILLAPRFFAQLRMTLVARFAAACWTGGTKHHNSHISHPELDVEFLLLHQSVEVGELHGERCSPLTGGAQRG